MYSQANSTVISLEYTDSSETNSASIMTVLIRFDTQSNEIIQYSETRQGTYVVPYVLAGQKSLLW